MIFKSVQYQLIFWLLVLLPINILFSYTGRYFYNGFQWCNDAEDDGVNFVVYSTVLIYVYTNCFINYLIYSFRNSTSEILPQLSEQVRINTIAIPCIFLSSMVFQSIGCFIAWNSDSLGGILWPILLFFMDQVMNNFGMYVALHTWGSSDTLAEDRSEDESENVELAEPPYLHMNLESRASFRRFQKLVEDLEHLVWISIPGGHPIRVKMKFVLEHQLWKYLITDARSLKQIHKHKQPGFIPCLKYVCHSWDDLCSSTNNHLANLPIHLFE